jgi:hypothetical protein
MYTSTTNLATCSLRRKGGHHPACPPPRDRPTTAEEPLPRSREEAPCGEHPAPMCTIPLAGVPTRTLQPDERPRRCGQPPYLPMVSRNASVRHGCHQLPLVALSFAARRRERLGARRPSVLHEEARSRAVRALHDDADRRRERVTLDEFVRLMCECMICAPRVLAQLLEPELCIAVYHFRNLDSRLSF